MIIQKNIVLKRTDKKPILIDTFYPENSEKLPVVIFCHGYKGFKDWGAWHIMAQQIANSGFCFVKFNFSHNGGTMEQPIDFPDLEAFGHNNYSTELDDLNDVIDWVQHQFKNHPAINTHRISLIGHSRGGGIALLKAAEDTRINTLVSLASVSDFGSRFGTTDELQAWRTLGVKFVVNGRTKQQMPHYYQFYEDYKANEDRLHIASATKQLKIPHLIIHGDKDTSVSINEAEALHQWHPKSQLEIVKGADHVFNTTHPWHKDNLSKALNAVVNLILAFLKRN